MSHADPNYPGNLIDTLSEQDKKRVEIAMKESEAHRFLKNRHKLNFDVGDILVRKMMGYNRSTGQTEVSVEKVSYSSPVPRKYKCIHIDEYGIPYVKVISTNGKEGVSVMSCTSIDLDNQWFEQDPDQVAHVILSDDEKSFDPLEAFKNNKAKREQIRKQNRAIRENTSTSALAREAFKKLKPGDRIYRTYDKDTCYSVDELEIVSIEFPLLAEINVGPLGASLTSWRKQSALTWASQNSIKDIMMLKVKPINSRYSTDPEIFENEIVTARRYWYFTKPRSALHD
jgi:hypothetical protein